MIKKLTLENWKSFRKANLYIDPLTVLIGKNSSGKSNIVDSLDFLSRIAREETFEEALNGNNEKSGIRGGEWVIKKSAHSFCLKIFVDGLQDFDYLYSLKVNRKNSSSGHGFEELLIEINENNSKQLGVTSLLKDATYHNFITQENLEAYQRIWSDQPPWPRIYQQKVSCSGFNSIDIAQLSLIKVFNILKKIFVLDPIPSQMRNYSPLSKNLTRNAANISGVIAALPEPDRRSLEVQLQYYLSQISEGELRKIWAEPIGRLGKDAMLYCEEAWPNQSNLIIDATGMSDGTLRFLAILTAMLTRPEESLIVIEEVDNGLHPSRAGLLLQMLREIGEKRKIDVLVTTHNPALLDELAPDLIPFVMVTYRNKDTGESQLIPLEDLDDLPKLIASGSLGTIVKKELIEQSLK